MKTTLSSLLRLFSARAFTGKLCLPGIAVAFCFWCSPAAATSEAHEYKNALNHYRTDANPARADHPANAIANKKSPGAAGIFSTTISSINTAVPSLVNAASVQYTVTFGSAVTGLTTANFSLTTTGVTGASVSSVAGSGSVYTVTVNTGTGDGVIGLNLANGAGISPDISTALPFTGQSYTIDKTAPGVGSLYDLSSNVNYAMAVVGDVITLYFSTNEPIQTPATVTIGGHSVTPVNTGVNQYQASYTMASSDPSGRVHFTLEFTDLAGNGSGLYNDLGAGDDIEFSNTAPSASDVSFFSNNGNKATAIIGNKVTLLFTASEAIQMPVITIAGHSVTTLHNGVNMYKATYDMTAADAAGNIAFDATLTDASNVTTHITNISTGKNILFNNTPTLAITGTVPALNTVPGVVSATVQFKVSGFNLSAGITVQPPTGFELSADNTTFSRNITIGTGGVIAPATVYIRLAATDLSGTYASDVLVSSAGASERSLTVGSSKVAVQLGSLSLSSGSLSPVFNGATGNYTASVPGAISSITVTPRNADGVASIKVNNVAVVSGMPSASLPLALGPNNISIAVTSLDNTLTKTYQLTVTRVPSSNTYLSNLKINNGAIALNPLFHYTTLSYTASVPNATTSVSLTPVIADANATAKINGVAVESKAASPPIALNAGPNIINTVVTAQDGTTTGTYSITVTRAPSSDASLANLALSNGTLSPVFASGTAAYTATVNTNSITLTPTAGDATASIKVNGNTVLSGTASAAIALALGQNIITTKVTAQDGTTIETYTLTITRLSSNVNLSSLKINNGNIPLNPAFNFNTTTYTASVTGATASVRVTPATSDANATVKINGTTVASGTASGSLPLSTGPNTITTIVTAQDGTTTRTYTITVTRAAGPVAGMSFEKPIDKPLLAEDALIVHQAVSPNGDGSNDFLIIDGIANHPENKLTIMNRGGQLVFEASGYNNTSKVFDGHSNKTGAKQLPGTYFYSLAYKVKGVVKHKTGYIVLKW